MCKTGALLPVARISNPRHMRGASDLNIARDVLALSPGPLLWNAGDVLPPGSMASALHRALIP
jgi:hypothetical protein